MRSMAICSQKGGVGKTTLSLNLAYALARRGWKTLLIDADPQGSVGLSLQGDASQVPGLVEVLAGEAPLASAIRTTRLPELGLLTTGRPGPSRTKRWAEGLAEGGLEEVLRSAADGEWEIVVVDTDSGLHGATLDVLRAVDSLVVPIQAEPLALRTVPQILECVGQLRDEGVDLSIGGFVITMLSSRQDVSLSVAQEAWSMLPSELILEAFVPRDEAFLMASAHGVPLGLLSRRPPPVATVFDRLAAELELRVGLIEEEAELAPVALLD